MAATATDRGREVRRRLVRAARELVPELGWHAVSTRRVAERAGVAPGLVHYHFDSVPALLAEAALGALREAVGDLEVLLERIDRRDALVDALLAELDRHTGRDPASLLATEAYLAATRDPALRRELAAVLEDFRHRVAAWLAGHGVPDAAATSAVLTAAVDGLLLQRAMTPDVPAADLAPVLRRLLTGERTR
jgi:AcrR family transcriptional regulator